MLARAYASGSSARWQLAFPLAAVGVGALGGVALVALGPVVLFGALLGVAAGVAMLRSPQVSLLVFVAAVSLLPFGVIPLRLGVQLTLLDATLTLMLLVSLLTVLRGREVTVASALNGPLALFIGLACVSFILGTSFSFSADLARYFLKLVNSMLLYFTVLHVVRTRAQLGLLIQALMVAGALEAAIAVVLYLLPPTTIVQLLSALRPLGYPSGPEVLRTIPDTETLRAVGTSIDPNLLGGLLMMSAALTVGQALAPRPLLPRPILGALAAVQVAGLGLTYSRAAWVGFAVAVLYIGTFRYRRAWVVAAVAGLGLVFVPQGNAVLTRFLEAFGGHDPATALRLVEYRTATELIAQYPWFGVGFGSGPNVELFLGVSSLYLLIAEEMGLVGLGVFLVMMALLAGGSLRHLMRLRDPRHQAVALGLQACLIAALASGLFDHYFFRFPHSMALFWFYASLLWLAATLPETAAQTTATAEAASNAGAGPLTSPAGTPAGA
jgi:polysaccharide biosynthesis protein PslJ